MQKKVNQSFVIMLFLVTYFLLPVQNLCYAQKDKHFLMVWGDVGYSVFHTKWDGFNNLGNFGNGIGFGYNAIFWNHFMFSTGVEYLFLTSSTKPTHLIIHKDLIDTENDEYVMEYNIRRLVQVDKTHNVFLPVYIGFITHRSKTNFYFQAGGKIGYMFASNSNSKIFSYTTTGIYDRFIDPFKDMPNHYFTTEKYSRKNELNFNKLQAMLSFETGLDFPSSVAKHALRLSLFANYGIINRQTPEMQRLNKELIFFNDIPNDISVNSLYETNLKLTSQTNSIFAGVKLTVLFGVAKPPCPDCLPTRAFDPRKKARK